MSITAQGRIQQTHALILSLHSQTCCLGYDLESEGSLQCPGEPSGLGSGPGINQPVTVHLWPGHQGLLPCPRPASSTGQCLGTSAVVSTGGAPGTEWVEAGDAAPHPSVPGTAPHREQPGRKCHPALGEGTAQW